MKYHNKQIDIKKTIKKKLPIAIYQHNQGGRVGMEFCTYKLLKLLMVFIE